MLRSGEWSLEVEERVRLELVLRDALPQIYGREQPWFWSLARQLASVLVVAGVRAGGP